MEGLVNSSVIVDEHRALMGAVLLGVRSVHAGLNDAVQGLLTGFEVSQVIFFSHKNGFNLFSQSLSWPYIYASPPRLCMECKKPYRGSNIRRPVIKIS